MQIRRGSFAAFFCLLIAAAAHKDVRLRGIGSTLDVTKPSGNVMLQSEAGTASAKSKFSVAAESSVAAELGFASRMQTKMHAWLHPLSAAAVVTTIALQLSPMPSSLEIRKDRDVKRYDGYPYFSVLTGASQWCLYGSFAALTTHDMNLLTMVAANAPGVFFGVFYITNFFRFVPAADARNAALKRYLSIGFTLLCMELAACIVLGRGAVFWLGLLGAVGSAQIALSPFKTLPEVLRVRSTKSWPIDLCLWNLIQSWFTGGFGVANNDVWVWAPNLIGVIAAIFQLGLIAAFWEKSPGSRAAGVKLKATTALL